MYHPPEPCGSYLFPALTSPAKGQQLVSSKRIAMLALPIIVCTQVSQNIFMVGFQAGYPML